MQPYYPTTRPPPETLAARLDQLGLSLGELSLQLREGVARLIGESVAGAVRQAVRAVLGDNPSAYSYSRPQAEPYRPTTPWHYSHATPSWARDPEDEDLEDEDLDHYRRTPGAGPAHPGRWGPALAVGVQAASLWLRRRPSQRPLLAALSVGLVASVAALISAPLAAAALGLAGAAVGLVSAANAARASATKMSHTRDS
jgi:hypothetical protein